VATQEEPSTRTAMLPVPGKSSGNMAGQHFFLQRSFLDVARCRPSQAGGDAVALLILEQLCAKAASTTLVTLPIVHCAQGWSAAVRPRRIAPKRNALAGWWCRLSTRLLTKAQW
jgi:hypothetical protein